jgi:hypothetical protein
MRSNSIVDIILIEDAVESDGQKLDLSKGASHTIALQFPNEPGPMLDAGIHCCGCKGTLTQA